MTLGQKVRQARIRAGLTQEQAAGGRITRNMLSLIENDLSAPSMKTLEYLAAALGVTQEEIAEFERQQAEMPEPEPSPEERLAELEAQNQMLTQCLMEMSQIVYA